MISFLLALAQSERMPSLLEVTSPGEPRIAIEALVELGNLEPEHRYILREAAKNAIQYTANYSKRDIENLLSPGTAFRINLNGDYLRLGLTCEKSRLNSGLSVLHSVLTQPSFLPDSMKVQPLRDQGAWQPAYDTYPLRECIVEPEVARAVWSSVVNYKSVKVAVRGDLKQGEAKMLWSNYGEGWPNPPTSRLPFVRPFKQAMAPSKDVQLVILESPVLKLSGAEFHKALLACTLLGVGKECLLWKICREQLEMSYRQEAFLVSVKDGFRFRVAVATDLDGAKDENVQKLLTLLQTEVANLSEKNLKWAQGAALGYLKHQIPSLPMIVGVNGVLRPTSEDQLYLDLLWRLKTGTPWNANEVLEGVNKVTLDELKSTTLALISMSKLRK